MLSWDECYPPIVVNIIYVFCEKLRHHENKQLLKNPIFIYDNRLFEGN